MDLFILKLLAQKNQRLYFIMLLALCVLALAGAFLAQHLGYMPCHLCIYQRMPYAALIVNSLFALFLPRFGKVWLSAAILLIFSSIFLSSYHSAIELGLIELPQSCIASINYANLSLDELKMQIDSAKVADCSKPAIVLLGLSMAQWNLLFNILLACVSIAVLRVEKNAKAILEPKP